MAILRFLDVGERVTRLPHSFSSLAGNLNDDWWGRLHYDKILSNKSLCDGLFRIMASYTHLWATCASLIYSPH